MRPRNIFHFVLFFWLLTVLPLHSQVKSIDKDRLQEVIGYLASDELEGRRPGTPGDLKSAAFILEHFRKAKLVVKEPMGMQVFDVINGATPGPDNTLRINNEELIYSQDFVTLSFSGNTNAQGGLVFAGFGMTITNDTLQWDDWKGIEARGKWALLLRGSPDPDNPNSPFASISSERDKVLLARDQGAAGVIFVNGPSFQEKDALMDMFYDKSPASADIPVFQISRDFAVKLMDRSHLNLTEVEKEIIRTRQPASKVLQDKVEGSADVKLIRTPTYNIIGLLEGKDPKLKNEYIVIGAHYDHLGMGGPGSGSRKPDTLAVHNGADDNASGVAGVIELAYLLGASGGNKRSVLFMAFGAEEMGLLGSRYFVDHPVVALSQIVTMINFDMIGRLKEDRTLLIGGTGTAKESEEILDALKKKHNLELVYSQEGFGASDHASFYAKDIPVFFLSTGAHDDYHTPEDDVKAINFNGIADVLHLANDLSVTLIGKDQKLTFQEAGPKSRPRHGRGYKVTLGIMPDFAGAGGNGLRVDAVRPEGPAGLGGMKKGDLITAIDGKQVQSIYDYMARLKALEPGQAITVDVLRNEMKHILIIQL